MRSLFTSLALFPFQHFPPFSFTPSSDSLFAPLRRNARFLHGPTVARRKLYGHTLQLRRNFSKETSPIRASGKLEKSTSRHDQIKLEGFFGDRIIISVDSSRELLHCFSFFFSRLDRSPFPKESHDITRSIPSTKFTAKLLIPVDEARDAQPEIRTRSFLQRVNRSQLSSNEFVRTTRRSAKSRLAFCRGSRPVAKVITFSDVRWTTISYRRGIATYRALSLARSSRILFLGCGFARYNLLGNWTWSGHAGSVLAAHLLPLLYLWVAKFTKRCGPSSECLPYNAPVQRRHSALHGSKPSDELARRPRTPSISQKTFQKFYAVRAMDSL